MPVTRSAPYNWLSVDTVQAHLDLLIGHLESGDIELADIIGAYMSTSRIPLCGRSLEQATSKDDGRTFDIYSVGPVDKPSHDAVSIFSSAAPSERKILLLSVLSFCRFEPVARRRVNSLAQAFDMMIEKGIAT